MLFIFILRTEVSFVSREILIRSCRCTPSFDILCQRIPTSDLDSMICRIAPRIDHLIFHTQLHNQTECTVTSSSIRLAFASCINLRLKTTGI